MANDWSQFDDKADKIEQDLRTVRSRLGSMAGAASTLYGLYNLLKDNVAKEQQIMSQITKWAEANQVSLSQIDSTLTTIENAVKHLDQMIADFQNSPGQLSAEDQTALDNIQSFSKSLVAKTAAISTAAQGTETSPATSPDTSPDTSPATAGANTDPNVITSASFPRQSSSF